MLRSVFKGILFKVFKRDVKSMRRSQTTVNSNGPMDLRRLSGSSPPCATELPRGAPLPTRPACSAWRRTRWQPAPRPRRGHPAGGLRPQGPEGRHGGRPAARPGRQRPIAVRGALDVPGGLGGQRAERLERHLVCRLPHGPGAHTIELRADVSVGPKLKQIMHGLEELFFICESTAGHPAFYLDPGPRPSGSRAALEHFRIF